MKRSGRGRRFGAILNFLIFFERFENLNLEMLIFHDNKMKWSLNSYLILVISS